MIPWEVAIKTERKWKKASNIIISVTLSSQFATDFLVVAFIQLEPPMT